MSGKIKDLSALVARYEAKIALKPSKAADLQAKLTAKINAQINKGNTVQIDGANVTSYTLDTNGSGGSGGSGGGTTGSTFTLTTSTNEIVNGTSSSGNYAGLLSSDATKTTFNTTDLIADSSTTDSDEFTLTIEADVTAANVGLTRNIETIKVNANATTLTDTTLDFAATNFTGVTTFEFDVTRANSAIQGLAVTAVATNDIVKASSDFNTVNVTVGTAGNNVTVDTDATGTTAVTIAAGTAAGDVTATSDGTLALTSTASTGMLTATAAKGLTIDAAAATVQLGTASAGNLTVSDASAAVVASYTASGDVSASDLAANNSLTVVAGGTISLLAGGGSVATVTGSLSGVGTSTADAMNTLTSLTLSGNGGAATYNLTAGTNALSTVTITGNQSVTLQVSAASIDLGTADTLSVTDNSTAGTFTLELQTASGDVDLRGGGLIDRLELDVDLSEVLFTRTGQNVTVTTDQTNGGTATFTVGTAAAAATNSLTLTLDDESTANTNAVDLDTVTITQAKTVTIDGSVDRTAAGAAVTHTLDAINASGANSNVTITMGRNNLILDGAVTAGTGVITVTGSGTVTDATLTLTATTFDGSAATGALTFDAATINVANVKTGSGNDTLALSNNNGGTFEMGLGNDGLTLHGSDLSNTTVSIDLGGGTDTLTLLQNSKLITGASGSITLAGVENIVLANNTGQSIQGALLSAQTYAVRSTAASNTNSVALVVKSTDTLLNYSTLVGSTDTATTINGMTFVSDASANASAIAITGLVEGVNTITGSSAAGDTLTGGSRADTFVVLTDALLFDANNVMLDTIAGGSQAASTYDQITVGTSGTAVSIVAADNFSKLTGVEQIAVADNSAAISMILGTSAESAGISRVTYAGDSTGDAVTNTLSVAAYTTATTLIGSANADSITGGSAADTITGGVGADTMTGGDGNDTFVILTSVTAVSTNALIDSIVGGNGTDTIQVGTNGSDFAIAATDSFARAATVERILAVANTGEVDIKLAANAWDAGIREIDISAGSKATGNEIDIDLIVGGGMTVRGSSTGVTTFTGGAGADTVYSGSAADVINMKESKDVIMFGASAVANGEDTITVDLQDADVMNFSAFLGSYSIIGDDGVGTDITMIADDGTADVNIAGKLAILDVAHADAATVDTAAELFALIDGTGDALALSSGKAVVIAFKAEQATNTGNTTAKIFFVDTSADGASGLSVNDVTLVGNMTLNDSANTSAALITTMFG